MKWKLYVNVKVMCQCKRYMSMWKLYVDVKVMSMWKLYVNVKVICRCESYVDVKLKCQCETYMPMWKLCRCESYMSMWNLYVNVKLICQCESYMSMWKYLIILQKTFKYCPVINKSNITVYFIVYMQIAAFKKTCLITKTGWFFYNGATCLVIVPSGFNCFTQ